MEELIYKRFTSSKELVSKLAEYGGVPAVFSTEPPDDGQEGWGGKMQYPKIIYSFDLQANQERRSAGALTVSLLCQNTADIMPETMEPLVKNCLRDVVLKPKGGTPYGFAWARTDAFTIEESMTIGSEIRFDIIEYPSQETSDPDPVMAVNQYIKEAYPECLIIGYDRMGEITEPSVEQPVVYCRLLSAEKSKETNTVVWMDGKIAVHILCPDSGKRMKLAQGMVNSMSLAGEVIMLDHSPMFIKKLEADYKSDYLKDGQVFITGHYGLLRYQEKPHALRAIHVTYH